MRLTVWLMLAALAALGVSTNGTVCPGCLLGLSHLCKMETMKTVGAAKAGRVSAQLAGQPSCCAKKASARCGATSRSCGSARAQAARQVSASGHKPTACGLKDSRCCGCLAGKLPLASTLPERGVSLIPLSTQPVFFLTWAELNFQSKPAEPDAKAVPGREFNLEHIPIFIPTTVLRC